MDNSTCELSADVVCCPACGSREIVATADWQRDVEIWKCTRCGEMYAAQRADIYNLGVTQVFAEWHGSYAYQLRLMGGGGNGD